MCLHCTLPPAPAKANINLFSLAAKFSYKLALLTKNAWTLPSFEKGGRERKSNNDNFISIVI